MKCPKCGLEFDEHFAALSRVDNTKICSECGQKEALDDYFGG